MKLSKYMRGSALAGCLVLAGALSAQNNGGIIVDVNGQPVSFANGSAMMIGGRVMVPLRGVLENLGANVQWDPNSQTITCTKPGTNVSMRIGDRFATVNGQQQPLDVPAQIYGGTTMVPLRFLSETFGANVDWNAQTQTVNINEGNALNQQPMQTQSTTTTQALTSAGDQPTVPLQFHDDISGWIAGGQSIKFEMDGTPGGKATLFIPGVATDVPMQETSSGHYEATWTPTNDQPVTVIAASAMGKLTLGDKTYVSPAVSNINVDMTPPVVSSYFPVANATISGFKPEIRVNFTDDASGIDPSKTHMTFNGQDVTANCKITDRSMTYDLPNDLTPGQYTVAYSVGDKAGNVTTKNWTFSVIGNSITSNFTHTGPATLRPGDHVTFTLHAAPGCQVVTTLSDGVNIPMTETSPGVYTCDYTVRPYDRLSGQLVTATITPPNGGQVYTIQAPEPLGAMGDISPSGLLPIIASPLASAHFTDPLVVSGSAPPASTVIVHVRYTTWVGPKASVDGELADVAVPVDTAGNWQTRPLHIAGWGPDSRTVLHITARTVLPDGTQSDPTELVLRQQ